MDGPGNRSENAREPKIIIGKVIAHLRVNSSTGRAANPEGAL
jgi:hypothetical protein